MVVKLAGKALAGEPHLERAKALRELACLYGSRRLVFGTGGSSSSNSWTYRLILHMRRDQDICTVSLGFTLKELLC